MEYVKVWSNPFMDARKMRLEACMKMVTDGMRVTQFVGLVKSNFGIREVTARDYLATLLQMKFIKIEKGTILMQESAKQVG